MKTIFWVYLLFGLTILLTSCRVEQTKTPVSMFSGEKLTPYATITLTPTVTATPQNAPTATLAPTMTPTPRTYQVKDKDTMIVIAFKNGITLDELKAANPDIDPYLLTVGMTLLIPAPKGTAATQNAPTPTPFPLTVYEPKCTPALSGGLYCFVQIQNEQEFDLDNITAEFRLTNPQSGEVVTQKALLPLSRIVPGTTLPLFAYFPPPVYLNPGVTLQLQTAMRFNQDNLQIMKVRIDGQEIKIAENGLSAVVNAQAALESAEAKAGKLWIAAVAFDAQDQIIGIRRYESPAVVKPDEITTFSLNIYSIGGKIARVDLFGEAIP
ncbi:MAG: hypothetical protein C0401_05585 [Anaerolinea sp.]|nr:hypothetical protein [Anaerolinea sp.]